PKVARRRAGGKGKSRRLRARTPTRRALVVLASACPPEPAHLVEQPRAGRAHRGALGRQRAPFRGRSALGWHRRPRRGVLSTPTAGRETRLGPIGRAESCVLRTRKARRAALHERLPASLPSAAGGCELAEPLLT